MTDDWNVTDANVAPSFGQVAVPQSLAVIELVRHLARISAENDYKEFLNSLQSRYSGPEQKGSPQ